MLCASVVVVLQAEGLLEHGSHGHRDRRRLLGSHRAEGEDDRVVHEVHRDRGQEAVVEQQPEQQHAAEPGVDPTEQAEVLVRVAEGRGRRDDSRTEHPRRPRGDP